MPSDLRELYYRAVEAWLKFRVDVMANLNWDLGRDQPTHFRDRWTHWSLRRKALKALRAYLNTGLVTRGDLDTMRETFPKEVDSRYTLKKDYRLLATEFNRRLHNSSLYSSASTEMRSRSASLTEQRRAELEKIIQEVITSVMSQLLTDYGLDVSDAIKVLEVANKQLKLVRSSLRHD